MQYDQRTSATGGTAALPLMNPGSMNPNIAAGGKIQAGQALTNTATVLQDTHLANQQRQRQEDEQTAALWSAKAVSQARLDWTQKLNEMQDQSTGDGAGFSNNVIGEFDRYQAKMLQSAPNNASRKYLSEQLTAYKTQLGTQAIEYQNKQRIDYNVNTFKDTLNNNTGIIALDPTQAPQVYGNTLAAISQMQVPEETKLKLKEASRKQIVDTYVSSQLRNNAYGFKNQLAPSVGQLPQGTNEAKIAAAATQNGNDPLVSLAIAQIESGVKPEAESSVPGSTAKGMFQFTDATWLENGGTKENRNDPQAQIEVAQRLQQKNANYLRAHLGREPSPTEQYMAHFLGAGGANAVLHADPSMSMADVVKEYDPKNADAIIKGNHLEGKTVGQVLSSYDSKMKSAMDKFASKEQQAASPFIQNIMTPQERDQAVNMAKQLVNSQAETYRTNMQQTIQDQTAGAMKGVMPAQALTQDNFNMMYPTDQAQANIQYNTYKAAIDTGLKINQMATMNPTQQDELIKSIKPIPNTPGYAKAVELEHRMLTAKAEIIKQKAEAPVAFVSQHDPLVKQNALTMQQSNTPETRKAYYDSVIAAQKQVGIMFPKLLDDAQEDSVIQQISHAQGTQRVQLLSQLSKQYGEHWGVVANQISSNKSAPDGITAILSASNDRYAQQAALVSGQSEAKLAENLASGDKSSIDQELQKQLQPYIQSVGVGQQASHQVTDLTTNMRKQVYARVAMDGNVKKAVRDVVAGFTGENKYNYSEQSIGGGVGDSTLRIPIQYNQSFVTNNAKGYVKSLTKEDLNMAGAKLLKNPYDLTENADGFLGMVKSHPIWQTNKDDKSATLYFLGKNNDVVPVIGKDGKPITKSFAELNVNTLPAAPAPVANPSLPISVQR
jgi:hypothetical protein